MVASHWTQMGPLISISVAYDQFSETSANKHLIAYTSLGLHWGRSIQNAGTPLAAGNK